MQKPIIPPNESERLLALQRYQILDTLPEPDYDDLTQLAAAVCETPIALISLVDRDRQWFKARVGLEADETPRAISFCGHVVAAARTYIVPDTYHDDRFADNPLVCHAPHIRFYAASPLMTPDGYPLGTLCVIDHRPRTLTETQVRHLEALSRLVMNQLELRRQAVAARLLTSVVESSGDAIITQDLAGLITSWNPAAATCLGYPAAAAIGQSIQLIFPPTVTAPILQALGQGQTIQPFEATCRCQSGADLTVSLSLSPLKNLAGQVVGAALVLRDLTERKQAELALQEREVQYRRIVETANEGIWMVDAANQTTFVNQKMADMLGLAPSVIIGRPLLEFVAPPDRSLVATCLAQSGAPSEDQAEIRLQRPDGTQLWVLLSLTVLRENTGAYGGALAMVTNISDRHQAAQAIKQQLAAMEAAIDGIAVLVENRFVYVNRAQVDLFGYRDPADLLGQPRQQLYGPAEQAWFEQEVFPRLHRDRAWQGEAIATRRDGSTFVEGLSLTLTDEGCLICVCRDISDHKRIETALQESEEKFRQLADVIDAVLWILPLHRQKRVYVSPAFERIWGRNCQDLYVTPDAWVEAIHPEDRDHVLAAIPKQIQGQFDEEYRIVRPDGEIRWIRDRAFPIRNQQGEIYRIAGIAEDISERQRAKAELQRTNEKLTRATRLKDEFLANMSHELRTPLNAVLGMAEGLKEQIFGPINEQQTKALDTIEKSGTHLLNLINEILDVAKIESGQLHLEIKPTAIDTLCQTSLDLIKSQATQKQLQLELKLPSDLPLVPLDEQRIYQVLINLLSNAVKFTPSGGAITLEVSWNFLLEQDTPRPHLRLAVIDTGIGIAPEHQGKLFQPFVQIDSALNRQYQGTGLGLALVKHLVELHGGQVGLTSTLGVGSCFTVDLPWRLPWPPSSSGDLPRGVGPTSVSPTDSLTTPFLLWVEDNEANTMTVSSYLRAKGYRLAVATGGEAAIALAQTELPDLVLLDIPRSGKDGLAAIQHLRRDPQLAQVPIIALTALAMVGDRDRYLAAGANEYLSRPIKLKQLATTIHQLLMTRKPT